MKECPNCFSQVLESETSCECGYRFSLKNIQKSKERSQMSILKFKCSICTYERIIENTLAFDAFQCQNCKTIYAYEKNWIENKFIIKVIKKSRVINEHVRNALFIFSLDVNSLDLVVLKSKYKELMAMYHPDKVDHLAVEFKHLANEKTREINNAYQVLCDFINEL